MMMMMMMMMYVMCLAIYHKSDWICKKGSYMAIINTNLK